MLLLGNKAADERLASLILLCLRRPEKPDSVGLALDAEVRIELPLSRTEIAQFLGLTIETVSRMLKRLSIDGVIAVESGRGIRIRDRAGLQRRAEASKVRQSP